MTKKTKLLGGAKSQKDGVEYPILSAKQIKSFVTSLKVGDLIEIQWIDAYSERGWKEAPKNNPAHACHVAGYYINSYNGYVRVGVNKAVYQSETWHDFSDHWGIPTGMIYGLRKL